MRALPIEPRTAAPRRHSLGDQAVTIIRHTVGGVPVVSERIDALNARAGGRSRTFHRLCSAHLRSMVRTERQLQVLSRTVETLAELRALVAQAYELLGHRTIVLHAPPGSLTQLTVPSRLNSEP